MDEECVKAFLLSHPAIRRIDAIFHYYSTLDSHAPNFGAPLQFTGRVQGSPSLRKPNSCCLTSAIQLQLLWCVSRREGVSGVSCKTRHGAEIRHFMGPQGMIKFNLMSVCRQFTLMGQWPLISNTPTS